MADYLGPTEKELDLAKKKWGFENKQLHFIRGNENWVYEVDTVIFRFTGKYHRDVSEIRAELDWIVYLAEGGLSVSIPIESKDTSLIEEISDIWTCVVFRKAPGDLLKEIPQFKKEVFLSWGKLTGSIHKATRLFSHGESQRHQWDEDDGYLLSQQALKSTDPSHPMAIYYVDLLKEFKQYKKSQDCFGLIHGDFHHGNFHYDSGNNQITLFDFDDSNYFWYAFDLAVPFASLELSKHFRGLDLDYTKLQQDFMEAYHKEYSLDSYWIDQIPLFMKYRFASLYFWSKGRLLNSRVNSDLSTQTFMDVCEKLTLEV